MGPPFKGRSKGPFKQHNKGPSVGPNSLQKAIRRKPRDPNGRNGANSARRARLARQGEAEEQETHQQEQGQKQLQHQPLHESKPKPRRKKHGDLTEELQEAEATAVAQQKPTQKPSNQREKKQRQEKQDQPKEKPRKQQQQKQQLCHAVFVRNLPFDVDSDTVASVLQQFGSVQNTFIVKNEMGEGKGAAFVYFADAVGPATVVSLSVPVALPSPCITLLRFVQYLCFFKLARLAVLSTSSGLCAKGRCCLHCV